MTSGVARRSDLDGRGVLLGVGACTIWGLFPAFWVLLDPAGPIEVLAHRILWTTVLMAVVFALLHRWGELRRLPARGWVIVAAAATCIAVNWGAFIYGVAIDQVVEVALGYYMNPLMSVLLGVLVLRERLRPLQWVALTTAAAAVVVISVGTGAMPWLGLALATSFAVYGVLKKTVPLDATASLTAEGVILGPVSAVAIAAYQLTGTGTLTGHGPWHVALLVAAGPVTAVPLLLFGAAARRIPLTTLGTLMYITPSLQFLWGVLVKGEAMPPVRWVGFVLVWIALVVLTADLVRATRPPRILAPPPAV